MSTTTIRIFLCLCGALLLAGMPPQAKAGETATTSTVTVTKEARITATIENKPLPEALRMLAEKNLFQIKGAVPAGEPVTVHFSNVTLDEALRKLMRGYNYVLMGQGTNKPSLMVMGKIQADRAAAQATPAQTAQPAAASGQGLVPGTYYVPPTLLPPAPSPSPAAPAARKTPEHRPPEQGGDPAQTADQQQGAPQGARPPEQPGTANPPQQPQQQSGEPQQQGDQPQTQPAQSSGVSARDLLGRSGSSSL